MKRLLSLLLVVGMVFSLAACSGTPSANEDKNTNGGTDQVGQSVAEQGTQATTGSEELQGFMMPTDLAPKKIAAVGAYSGNELYLQWKKNLESLAEPFNVELQFVEVTATDDSASVIESLCTAGIDGIITQTVSESLVKIAQAHNVAWMVYCSVISDELMQILSGYDNFCGVVAEDDIVTAKHCAEAMYDAGCRKVGVVGLTRGYSDMMDNRADFFIERFKELGGEIIAEDYTLMQFAGSISTFAAAHPDMDGVFSIILNESVFQAVTTEGLVGTVKLGGFDLSDSSPEFYNNGTLVFSATGQQATILAAFAPLYNYLYDGTYLIEDRAKTVNRSFIEILNSDEYEAYNQYVRFSTCYAPEEIGYMIKGINPDYTFADYVKMNEQFSIDDVVARTEG